MSTATVAIVQLSLFDLDVAYTEADRIADRQLCRGYLNQWASSFKSEPAVTEICTADFKAAAARLAL
ncbi:hypothetical protein JOF28_000292 [Leucobacter exalbidus]|uniref:Uncharacterized protein n=1 Tax=Leucobacter exalbidus TaxID=662960 RepID=A0A940PKZ0_9MICO|nr:hypothetical protein [Leucobacter exalbidus]MBP1325060.1 hypothetical protein [Leucobacter exalbidus]